MTESIIRLAVRSSLPLLVVARRSLADETQPAAHLERFEVGKEGRQLLLPVNLSGRTLEFVVHSGATKSAIDVSLRSDLGPSKGRTVLRKSACHQSSLLYACPNGETCKLSSNSVGEVGCLDLAPL